MKTHAHVPMRLTADGVEPPIYACAVCKPELLWRKDQRLCVLCGDASCDGRHTVPTLQVVQMTGPELEPGATAADPSWWPEERAAAYRRAGGLRLAVLAAVVLVFAALIAATIAASPATALPLAAAPSGVRAIVGEVIAWSVLIGLFALAGAAMARRDRERRR